MLLTTFLINKLRKYHGSCKRNIYEDKILQNYHNTVLAVNNFIIYTVSMFCKSEVREKLIFPDLYFLTM